MLSKAQERLIRSLHAKKGRSTQGLCLAEGAKIIDMAGDLVEFSFTAEDTPRFTSLVTTETPQMSAAVVRIPTWSIRDIAALPTTVVLDGVQDPGNVGSILRLCLGFGAGLVLLRSADPTAPKTVRSSAGAAFRVPWMRADDARIRELLEGLGGTVLRLERTEGRGRAAAADLARDRVILIAGAEGHGITIDIEGKPYWIDHDPGLESLNVGHALAIALHERYRTRTAP